MGDFDTQLKKLSSDALEKILRWGQRQNGSWADAIAEVEMMDENLDRFAGLLEAHEAKKFYLAQRLGLVQIAAYDAPRPSNGLPNYEASNDPYAEPEEASIDYALLENNWPRVLRRA